MKEVDLERRKIRGFDLKKRLKASRIAYPQQTDDGWWHVYSLRDGNIAVYFRRENRAYRVRSAEATAYCKDVEEFSREIAKYA